MMHWNAKEQIHVQNDFIWTELLQQIKKRIMSYQPEVDSCKQNEQRWSCSGMQSDLHWLGPQPGSAFSPRSLAFLPERWVLKGC